LFTPEKSSTSKLKALDIQEERSEKLHHALFQIASIDYNNNNIDSFHQNVHNIIAQLIYSKNFFIALYSEEYFSLTIPYFIDEKDEHGLVGRKWLIGRGLVPMSSAPKPQLLYITQINKLIAHGEIEEVIGSTDFTSWMGAPMISANFLHGLIVI
jgi:hypothetical protein